MAPAHSALCIALLCVTLSGCDSVEGESDRQVPSTGDSRPSGLGPAIQLQDVSGPIAGVRSPLNLGHTSFGVVVGRDDIDSLEAFDSVTGDRLWQFVPPEDGGSDSIGLSCSLAEPSDPLVCLAAYSVADELVLSKLVTLSAMDGTLLTEVEVEVVSRLVHVSGSTALLISRDFPSTSVFAADTESGETAWRFNYTDPAGFSIPVIDGVAYLTGAQDEEGPYTTKLVDVATGSLVAEVDGTVEVYGGVPCVETEGRLTCLSSDGSELWSGTGEVMAGGIGGGAADRQLVLIRGVDVVTAYNVTSGDPVWETNLGLDFNSALYVSAGAIVSEAPSSLVLLDAASGQELGRFSIAETDWVDFVAVGDHLYAVGPAEATSLSGQDLSVRWSMPYQSSGEPLSADELETLDFRLGEGVTLVVYGTTVHLVST